MLLIFFLLQAILIVSTGWPGVGYSSSSTFPYAWPAGGGANASTTILGSWAPNAACNPAVANVSSATNYTQAAPLTMSLLTHAFYRVDMAMGLDATTWLPTSGQPFGYSNPSNKVVAFLWHQGEADANNGLSVHDWSACFDDEVSAWRTRYTPPSSAAVIPFIAGTFSVTQDFYFALQYTDFLRATFGRGLYGAPQPSSPFYEILTNASAMPTFSAPSAFAIGLADSHFELVAPNASSTFSSPWLLPSPAPYDPYTPIHFSVLGCAFFPPQHFCLKMFSYFFETRFHRQTK